MLESQYERGGVIATGTPLICFRCIHVEDTSQDEESSEASGRKEEDESDGQSLEIN